LVLSFLLLEVDNIVHKQADPFAGTVPEPNHTAAEGSGGGHQAREEQSFRLVLGDIQQLKAQLKDIKQERSKVSNLTKRNILTRGRLQRKGDFNTGEFNAATMSMLGRFQRQEFFKAR
jgi:hypothetical protein